MIQKRKNNRDSNGDKATAQAEAGNRGRPPPPEETLSLTGGRQKQEPGRTAEDVGTALTLPTASPGRGGPEGSRRRGPWRRRPALTSPWRAKSITRVGVRLEHSRWVKPPAGQPGARAVLGHQAARSSALLGSFPFGRLMSPVETKQTKSRVGRGFLALLLTLPPAAKPTGDARARGPNSPPETARFSSGVEVAVRPFVCLFVCFS